MRQALRRRQRLVRQIEQLGRVVTPWMTLADKPSLSRKMRDEWAPKPALRLTDGRGPGSPGDGDGVDGDGDGDGGGGGGEVTKNVAYQEGSWELDSMQQAAGPVKLGTLSRRNARISNFVTDHQRWPDVTYGRWYFEVTVRTAGRVLVGWADSHFGLKLRDGGAATTTTTEDEGTAKMPLPAVLADSALDAGLDAHSWVWDGRARRAYHAGRYELWGVRWKEGDVIGCLLDYDGGRITFTRNGEPMGREGTADAVPAFRGLDFQAAGGLRLRLRPVVAVVEGQQQVKVNVGRAPELHGPRYRYAAPHFRPFFEGAARFRNGPGEQCAAVATLAQGYRFDAPNFSELLAGRPNEVVGAWRSPGPKDRGLTTADPTRLRLISRQRALMDNLWTFAPWERDFLKLATAWADVCNLQKGFRGHYGRYRQLRLVRVVLRDDLLGRHERVVRAAVTLTAVVRGVLTRRRIRGARYLHVLQALR